MSRSLSKSSGQLSFPCAEIPEFAAYRQQMFVKTALLEETNGEREAFVARAMQTLDACVLGAPSREVGADKQLLKRLYHKGYARDDILRALAEAWYDESDTFSLPRRRFSALLDSGWFLWGLPLVLALFVLLELIDLLRHHYPGQAGLALWFAPVLGMLGFAIAAVLHGLIKGVIAVLERLAGAGRQAQRVEATANAATATLIYPPAESVSASQSAQPPLTETFQTAPQHENILPLAPEPGPQPTFAMPAISLEPQPECPMYLFAGGVNQVTLSNGVLRIQFVQSGPDNSVLEAGTLILPASQAGAVINNLTQTLQQLDEQLKAQQGAATH